MGIYTKKPRKSQKLGRKQERKEKRKVKKQRKNDFFSKKKIPGQFVMNPNRIEQLNTEIVEEDTEELNTHKKVNKKMPSPTIKTSKKIHTTEELRKKEFREQKKLEKQMMKHRNKQLLEANKEEDKVIKQLEKQLGLKKRKSKALPKGFSEEGLDYLLEVCDPERMKHAVTAERDLNDDDDFKEDFQLMAGKASKNILKKSKVEISEDQFTDDEDESFDDDDDDFNTDKQNIDTDSENNDIDDYNSEDSHIESDENDISLENSDYTNEDSPVSISISKKRKHEDINKKQRKKIEKSEVGTAEFPVDIEHSEEELQTDDDDDDITHKNKKGAAKINEDGTWEDIYGRLRGEDGSILTGKETSKYIPPAIRDKLSSSSENIKDSEKVIRLKRQLKGLLNRLAESNMHSIANQVEELYMNNSRNNMNDTLTNLIFESLVSDTLTPERLLIEHILLISILHANVGTEVGAHFLQTIVREFHECFKNQTGVENKTLDNIVRISAQLYNFKVFDAKLMYEILMQLAEGFDEKCIECILHILRSVGFNLRKDDPIALKNLILDLQKKAANVSDEDAEYTRIKFMLEILLAIKNNNVTKIPNYDVSYSEHLKKLMKGLIRKGNYVTQLNISLEDLLKADERGKWWVVGSAWSGIDQSSVNNEKVGKQGEQYSVKLLNLAKKQRMNTDTRRNIFCIIMSAEDYLDAFEKLLKLGLKNQQEREIINVILHCCLQEKNYNPYYAHLVQKFCDFDRKYQMIIKYSVWDKLKALKEHSGSQISSLAKLLIHIFIEKGLPISTLKIVQFSDLDKINMRFMRQILIGIILHEDVESCLAVFAKVSGSDKLKMFRESLRLFIHHFLLKNLKTESIPEEQKSLLEERAKMVEKLLVSRELRI